MLLAVAGSVVLIAGVLVAAVSAFLGQGRSSGLSAATLVGLGLIASGLFSGAVLVAIAVPGDRRVSGKSRRPARRAPTARLLPRPVPQVPPAAEGWLAPGAWPTPQAPPVQGGWPVAEPPSAQDVWTPAGPAPLPQAPPAQDVWTPAG
ncbi:MAG TPA: hypothetical protein DHU96_22915, partial [Actinobacteria bacterium]|nr:hypothetical protein [Actinomycetota bacterium]